MMASKDEESIQNPIEWPKWPLLPLKHNGSTKLGFVVAQHTPPFKVYIGNMYDLKTGKLGDAIEGLPVEEYPTVQSLCKDWRVD